MNLLIWANAREPTGLLNYITFKAVRGQITEIKMKTALKMPIWKLISLQPGVMTCGAHTPNSDDLAARVKMIDQASTPLIS